MKNNIMNPQDYGHLEFEAQAESTHQQKIYIKVKILNTYVLEMEQLIIYELHTTY